MLDKLKKIDEIRPGGSQILIRTDYRRGWFVHFYWKEYVDGEGWTRSTPIVRGYYPTEKMDRVLDEIIEWCENQK